LLQDVRSGVFKLGKLRRFAHHDQVVATVDRILRGGIEARLAVGVPHSKNHAGEFTMDAGGPDGGAVKSRAAGDQDLFDQHLLRAGVRGREIEKVENLGAKETLGYAVAGKSVR